MVLPSLGFDLGRFESVGNVSAGIHDRIGNDLGGLTLAPAVERRADLDTESLRSGGT